MSENSQNEEFSESENSQNDQISENEEQTLKDEEKILCRFSITKETTISLYEFTLEHPLEITDGDVLISTIQPSKSQLQEDRRISSLSICIGNKERYKTYFHYNNKEIDIYGPDIKWPVKDYDKYGVLKVKSNGELEFNINRKFSYRHTTYNPKRQRFNSD
ncbi:hypothetical protein C1645_732601 [Glomus cerebriforme]|uniref:Uncharacterized protein n=1 Tax=Glomus cerebriforme TaxID=658196 RepID=A0A397TJW2_9GLOM|nr:hypothetical protein C1645_732601 [Glomus cerebriforme]